MGYLNNGMSRLDTKSRTAPIVKDPYPVSPVTDLRVTLLESHGEAHFSGLAPRVHWIFPHYPKTKYILKAPNPEGGDRGDGRTRLIRNSSR